MVLFRLSAHMRKFHEHDHEASSPLTDMEAEFEMPDSEWCLGCC